ncbi:hypothetical protein BESB_076140 [Besnoitia besnoiti]|uniref:Uncharacterized protein n=1 Tax=Besnoitia besnoiti TaxID=94643 RepID=A0A2A9MCS3_BESBE|nr:hypothetical protein BESB_076140 [Besnoitia besnoiti]PFH33397.1 hypothetical protein BESB_076140 [Besnoitia besnoiti]
MRVCRPYPPPQLDYCGEAAAWRRESAPRSNKVRNTALESLQKLQNQAVCGAQTRKFGRPAAMDAVRMAENREETENVRGRAGGDALQRTELSLA